MAMATGDFERIFKDLDVPSCPQVVSRLLQATKDPDITIDNVASILEMDPGLSSKLLRMVNSSLYGLPSKVTSIARSVNLVGMKEIENLAIAYAVTKNLKDPETRGFDLKSFIMTSLYRAIFAREIAKFYEQEPEDAFTGGLMQDIAVPTLLTNWFDIYENVYHEWKKTKEPLENVEKRRLSWNHCEAGAWIAKRWEFPDILVCAIGLHSLGQRELDSMGFGHSIIAAISLSSRVPSIDEEEPGIPEALVQEGSDGDLTEEDIKKALLASKLVVEELAVVFGITT